MNFTDLIPQHELHRCNIVVSQRLTDQLKYSIIVNVLNNFIIKMSLKSCRLEIIFNLITKEVEAVFFRPVYL